MPIIYNGQIDISGLLIFTEDFIDHEPKYFLYFSFQKMI